MRIITTFLLLLLFSWSYAQDVIENHINEVSGYLYDYSDGYYPNRTFEYHISNSLAERISIGIDLWTDYSMADATVYIESDDHNYSYFFQCGQYSDSEVIQEFVDIPVNAITVYITFNNESEPSYGEFYLDFLCQNYIVKYTYDAGGNRLTRTLYNCNNPIVLKTGRMGADYSENRPEEEYQFELNDLNVQLFPNPTKGWLRLDFDSQTELNYSDIKINVYDLNGRLFLNVNSINQTNPIDLNGCSDGVYLLEIVYKNSKKSLKIIKKG